MGILERTLRAISPGWAAARERDRLRLNAYEAANPSRLHKAKKQSQSADTSVFAAGQSLREQARWLDENHDLVIGLFDKMEDRVIGAHGIHVEPQPLDLEGNLHSDFAGKLSALWAEWSVRPEVTGMFTRPEAERLLLRSALRDGEVFTQLVRGNVLGLQHSTSVPFSLEMLEADFVPFNLNSTAGQQVRQGIIVNNWGRPVGYRVYKYHPANMTRFSAELKTVSAENMLHLAQRKRLHQLRGISLIHGVITRLSDIKDYEESERVAARIAAALGFYIKRGDAQSLGEDGEFSPPGGQRHYDIAPGMIYDDLRPGEDLGMVESNRPNVHLYEFRNGQMRAVAAGTRGSYSSIARDYNGTYSSQRQELVESFEGYNVLQQWFVGQHSRPVYRAWLAMALLSGVEVPPDVDPNSLYNALYLGPVSRLKAKVDIWVDGVAASMASMIVCLPGATVHMPENAWIMVHKPWGGIAGDSDDMRDYAAWLDRNEALMLSAYMNKTGLGQEELEAMLKAETWLNGAEAVEKGFADTLEPELQAAACVNENKLKDYQNMPEQIKSLFAPRAEAPVNQPQQPAPVQTNLNPPAPQQPAQQMTNIDITALAQQLQQQMQTANAERVNTVSAVFEAFPTFATLKAECLADFSCTAEKARDRLLQALAAGTTPSAGPGAIHLYAGNGNLVGDSIRAAVMSRAGYAQAEKDNAYNGYTLRELARASLVDRGIGISGAGTAQAMVGLAFTHSSSDFGNILMDVAHKAALMGWDEATESFEQWTRKGTLTDFKTAHRVGLESLASLRKVRAGAEYKYVTIKDRGEPIALATYGELFSIDRQTIINDDLDMLTRIPQAMGLAARATVGDLVWAVLTSNPKMSDGKPLFHADHGNLVSADLSIEGLDTARKAMLLQKSGDRRLNIRPAYMLTPVAIESRANQLIKSASVPGADANSGIVNPIQNFVTVSSEARLDDSSPTDYYLTAAQGRDTIEVAYLDGIDTPYLEQQQGFTVDGAAFKVRIDAGVAPLDWRGMVKVTKK